MAPLPSFQCWRRGRAPKVDHWQATPKPERAFSTSLTPHNSVEVDIAWTLVEVGDALRHPGIPIGTGAAGIRIAARRGGAGTGRIVAGPTIGPEPSEDIEDIRDIHRAVACLLYTSPSPRD